jgi:Domain of unknown function (DUF1883)/TIR domain
MEYLYRDIGYRKRGDIVEVTLRGNAANVLLLDPTNFSAYKAGRRFTYHGGSYKSSPVRLPVPRSGRWYVVVNLGGLPGRVSAGIRVLPGLLPPGRGVPASPLGAIADNAAEYAEEVGIDPEDQEYDVFISHASEDKDSIVRELAHALRDLGLRVWYDEFTLRVGDSVRKKIDTGIRLTRFGVVVLSKSFFDKGWPEYELDGLVVKKVGTAGQIILPIWHGVDKKDVASYSPSLADTVALKSDLGVHEIARQISEVVSPEET